MRRSLLDREPISVDADRHFVPITQTAENPTTTTDSYTVISLPRMTKWLSLRDFTVGLLKRWYLLVPALALTPLDFINRFTAIEWDPPVGLPWAVVGVSWHHLEPRLRRQIDGKIESMCT